MTRATWKRPAAVATIFAAALAAAPAAAKPPPPPPPPGAPPAAPGGDTQKATQHYVKGSELFKAKKFIPALEQFKLSYETVPSPNSHLYIARCLAAMGETQKAWLEFELVAEEAAARAATEEKYRPTRDSANVERDELAPKLGLVTVNVVRPEAGTTVHVGPYAIPRARWSRPFPVEPGTYEARVETPNRPTVKTTFTVGRGEQRPLTLDVAGGGGPVAVSEAAPPPRKANPLRIAGIAATGVGVGGFITFAVAGAISKSTYSDLTTKCGGATGGCNGMNVSDEISKGKTQQAVANAGLVIGVVGAAAGVTMIVLSTRTKKDTGRPSADLIVGPSYIGVGGRF